MTRISTEEALRRRGKKLLDMERRVEELGIQLAAVRALLTERAERAEAACAAMREALELQEKCSFFVGAHDMGSGTTHRFAGDGAATGCRQCIADAARKTILAGG